MMKIQDELLPRLYRAIRRDPVANELSLRLHREKRPYDEIVVRCVEKMSEELATVRRLLGEANCRRKA